MSSNDSGVTWVCPGCGRRVPTRIENCRCGTMRPVAAKTDAASSPALSNPSPSIPVQPQGAETVEQALPAPGGPPASGPSLIPRSRAADFPPAATFDETLRHPGESTRFLCAAIVSALFWIVLVVSIVGMFYGAIFLALSLIARALFLAQVRGNGIEVSPNQLPRINAAVAAASRRLGLSQPPQTFVMQSEGALNAFAMKFIGRHFIVIYSALIDACADERQLNFVVAHEVGHLAAGHLKWLGFLAPAHFVPWLGMAYSRACEYTCDRCGLAVVEDMEAADRGLLVLAGGGKAAMQANVQAFMEQRQETGSFWSATVELGSTHPFLCKRVAALREFRQPGSIRPVSRNPLAFLFSPLFGIGGAAGGSASLLVTVAMIGIIAAIAIPSLLRARVAANEAAAIGDARAVLAAERDFKEAAGTYGPLECLADPKACIATYPPGGPAFLDKALTQPRAAGYDRAVVHADVQSFVFVAAPVVPAQTGVRVFCADASGSVCSAASVKEAWNGGSTCSSQCSPLQ